MRLSTFKTGHAFVLAFVVSALLILRQYTDYLINDYGYDFSWFAVSAKILVNYLLWASLFSILLRIANRLVTGKLSAFKILSHIGLSVIIAGAHRLLTVRLYDFSYYAYSGFLRDLFTPGNKVALGAGLFSSFIEYWIIMMLIVAISYYIRYVQQQKELNAAKLEALKMQLQPHFLFNTLNSITSLIDLDPKKAQKMLAQLGYLMREMLEHDKKHFITLENELAYIKTYLEIEHIRFQDRLTLNYDIDKELLQEKIPALLLQPIVENAIKHGIAPHSDGGEIAISIKQRESDIAIRIANDYPPMKGNRNGYGIGTKNVARRLQQLYGDDHMYQHRSSEGKYISEINLPLA